MRQALEIPAFIVKRDRPWGKRSVTRNDATGRNAGKRSERSQPAAQTAVKIMIPLILFIFPGVFVVLVGPAGIQMYETMIKK